MDLPTLRTIPFVHGKRLVHLREVHVTQEWTCRHGQRAGLLPSWLAWLWLAAASAARLVDELLLPQDRHRDSGTDKVNAPAPGYAAHSPRKL